MSKNKLHMNKIKHLHHPPGRALLKTEDQQQTILDKETGDITPRKKRISNTCLRSDTSGQSEDIFSSDRKPEQAKIGETVRFMYYQADGMATYWMQGKLTHRLDKYKVAKASNFVRNRFKVEQVKVITCWGVRGEIPETVTVNLSRSTVWSLGTETLVTTEEDEVITFEEGETCETSDETDETTDEASADDETTTSNRLVNRT